MAVIARPASTVVLRNQSYQIYLTKRPLTMKFLGGFYCFPGGSVENDDHIVESEYIRKSEQTYDSFNVAHYVAAARELFEEVGVFLGCKDDGSIVRLQEDIERKYRSLLLKGEITFLQLLKQEGLHLNLDDLKYVGHLVTPEGSLYRYDTRFFLTELPSGQTPKPDSREVDEAFWITPEEAVKAFEIGKISMALPTIRTLQSIINYLNGGPLAVGNK